jgi:hypothetical protein
MTALCRIGIALAIAQCVTGCVIQSSTAPSAVVTSPRAKVVALNRAKEAVVIGRSTRADVIAALGETLVISFDTGYEVWVYRLANARDAEFVILFSGSGIVAKTRFRPAPQGT